VATPPGERHSLPALMAAACLREDRWLVHHLASDLPVEEVTRLADQAGARLVVLSSALSQTARQAQQAAEAITATYPHLTVLAGRPGDRLHDLLARAANPHLAAANQPA
jgi:MerR family transcriptional regulator, light-induced transcriptional regulator